jgi:hypothetical protein
MSNHLPTTRVLVAVAACFAMVLSVGCSVTVYSRGVDGAGSERELMPGAVLAVVPDDPNQGDIETVAKIERLLVDDGFTIADVEDADFVVLYNYALSSQVVRRGLEPLSGATSGIRSAERKGPFDHTVNVRVVEAGPWLESGEIRLVWASAAQVADAPTESTRFLDVALYCAIDDLGETTDDTVSERIRIYDRRVRCLD